MRSRRVAGRADNLASVSANYRAGDSASLAVVPRTGYIEHTRLGDYLRRADGNPVLGQASASCASDDNLDLWYRGRSPRLDGVMAPRFDQGQPADGQQHHIVVLPSSHRGHGFDRGASSSGFFTLGVVRRVDQGLLPQASNTVIFVIIDLGWDQAGPDVCGQGALRCQGPAIRANSDGRSCLSWRWQPLFYPGLLMGSV